MTTHESNTKPTTRKRAAKRLTYVEGVGTVLEAKDAIAGATSVAELEGALKNAGAVLDAAATKRPRKASAKALAETIKAAAEAEVAEVIELKVRNRKASTTTARKPKAGPTPAQINEAVEQLATEVRAKGGTAKVTPVTAPAPTGYVVRWPHAGYDLLRKSDAGVDGAEWLVRCNAHGATTEAANTKSGDQLGRKADRAAWCAGCRA